MTTVICACCHKPFEKDQANITYQNKKGLNKFFCNKACFHESRRDHKHLDQKRLEKAEYDRQYREKNREIMKAKKHEWFKQNYNPAKAAVYRKARMPKHVEYCRKPEYKAKKQAYDQVHRAKQMYGEFWESAILVNQIEAQYDAREVRQINNLHNKSQKRKRQWHQDRK